MSAPAPPTLSIPVLRDYDVSTLTGLSNGNSVGSLTDRSGAGTSTTQATASAKPTYDTTDALNGYPVLLFDGVDDTLAESGTSAPGPISVVLVAKLVKTGGIQRFAQTVKGALMNAGPGWQVYAGNNLHGGTEDTAWHVFNCTLNAASSSITVDGTAVASGNMGTSTYTVYALGSSGSSQYANTLFARLLVFNGVFSEGDKTTIDSWVQDTYGITVSDYVASGPPSGSAAGTVIWTGSASGTTTRSGAAAGTVAWAGSASGTATHEGTASGAVAWTGAASGQATHSGTADGTLTWVGAATGTTQRSGTASGTVAWVGAASGKNTTARNITVIAFRGPHGHTTSSRGPHGHTASSKGPHGHRASSRGPHT